MDQKTFTALLASANEALAHSTMLEPTSEAAYEVIAHLTNTTPQYLEGKNPAAVLLGRLGGSKGGPARARKLTAERRSEIARHAANVRWRRR